MSTLYITEMRAVGSASGHAMQAGMVPPVADQSVTYTGTAGTSSALNANTRLVRLWSDAAFHVSFDSADATTSDLPIAATTCEYFSIGLSATGAAITISAIAQA